MSGLEEDCYIAIQRMPCAYGVPLAAFYVAAFGCTFLYTMTAQYDLIVRAVSCGVLFLAVVFVMQRLTAWEPHWATILMGWLATRARGFLHAGAAPLRGETVYSSLPEHVGTDLGTLRDYAAR